MHLPDSYPVPDLNRCCRRERAVSWAARRTGRGVCNCVGRGPGDNLGRLTSGRNRNRIIRFSAGVPGLEPRMDEPESPVLPITPYPSAGALRDARRPKQREIIYTRARPPTNPDGVSAPTQVVTDAPPLATRRPRIPHGPVTSIASPSRPQNIGILTLPHRFSRFPGGSHDPQLFPPPPPPRRTGAERCSVPDRPRAERLLQSDQARRSNGVPERHRARSRGDRSHGSPSRRPGGEPAADVPTAPLQHPGPVGPAVADALQRGRLCVIPGRHGGQRRGRHRDEPRDH